LTLLFEYGGSLEITLKVSLIYNVYLAELEEDLSLEGKERKPAFRRPPPVQGFMQLFFKFWGKL